MTSPSFSLSRHALDALFRNLRDVHQAILARQDGHERAEVHQARHAAFIDAADFDFGGDQVDAALGFPAGLAVDRRNLDRAVVVDVDRGAGFLGDGANDCAALADDFADLLRIDLDRDDRRCPLGHVLAGLRQHLVHLAEDVQTAVPGLRQRLLHDFLRDAVDLDVHLQRSDASAGTGHLEVHVAEVIFIAEDVGQHGELVAFLHRDPSRRRQRRP